MEMEKEEPKEQTETDKGGNSHERNGWRKRRRSKKNRLREREGRKENNKKNTKEKKR